MRKKLTNNHRIQKDMLFACLFCAPMGIRTPVWALRGPRPGPLDDGGVVQQLEAAYYQAAEIVLHASFPFVKRAGLYHSGWQTSIESASESIWV